MKKKSLLFLIYCLGILAGIVCLLVLNPKFTTKASATDNETEQGNQTQNLPTETEKDVEDEPGNQQETDFPEETKHINLTLNIPTEIVVAKGGTIELPTAFATVDPIEKSNELTLCLSNNVGSALSLNNLTINCFEEGEYNLFVKIKDFDETEIIKTVKINVVTNNLDIEILKTELNVGDTIDFNSIFKTLTSNLNVSVATDENINYNTKSKQFNFLKANNQANISISFVKNSVIYCYHFYVKINAVANYEIVINNQNSDIKFENNIAIVEVGTKTKFKIYYNIQQKGVGTVVGNQMLNITSSNTNVATINNPKDISFTVEYVGKGSTAITLTSESDPNCSLMLIINFV